jgi:hypothetical protein
MAIRKVRGGLLAWRATVLPLLKWLTVRCPPTFGRAGAFIACTAIILATSFGVGRFGDAAAPLLERMRGAQVATVTVTVCTLVLIALIAQREKSDMELRESEGQLQRRVRYWPPARGRRPAVAHARLAPSPRGDSHGCNRIAGR